MELVWKFGFLPDFCPCFFFPEDPVLQWEKNTSCFHESDGVEVKFRVAVRCRRMGSWREEEQNRHSWHRRRSLIVDTQPIWLNKTLASPNLAMGGIKRQQSFVVLTFLFQSICCLGLRPKLEILPCLLLPVCTSFSPGRRPRASSSLLLLLICHRRVKPRTTNPVSWRTLLHFSSLIPLRSRIRELWWLFSWGVWTEKKVILLTSQLFATDPVAPTASSSFREFLFRSRSHIFYRIHISQRFRISCCWRKVVRKRGVNLLILLLWTQLGAGLHLVKL